MHFYDAELLRSRALTTDDAASRHADLRAAIELARSQGARIFELRAAMDDFELDPASPRRQPWHDALSRFPGRQSPGRTCARAGRCWGERPRRRVAILGGGMAGLSAAWRLSEPGWRDRFESITVYQRGWRLGGKGASSRGATWTDRGARPARLAGVLRERLCAAARVLRRTRPCHNGSGGADPDVGPGA